MIQSTTSVVHQLVVIFFVLASITSSSAVDNHFSPFYRQLLLSSVSPSNLGDELRNSHIPGGVYHPGLNSWRDCVQACLIPCTAADFDENDGSCWHHYGPAVCALPKFYHVGVTHYRTVSCLTGAAEPQRPPALLVAPVSSTHDVGRSDIHSGQQLVRQSPPQYGGGGGGTNTCGRPAVPPSGSRIIGGDEARHRSWPWQIALRNKNARSSRCAGSLIAPQWVLTTAHCVDQDPVANNWLVLTGAHDLLAVEPGRIAHSVAEVIIHEKFNLDTFDSDVALIRLTNPVTWSSAVSPVCLPPPDFELVSGTHCIITGWGVASGGRRPLKQGGIPIVPMDTCRRPDWLGSEFTLTDRMMCAGYENGGVDTCQGDSGGPLVCFLNNHWVQTGITSFGRGCGLPQKPGVYAKVSRFIRWIQNVINKY